MTLSITPFNADLERVARLNALGGSSNRLTKLQEELGELAEGLELQSNPTILEEGVDVLLMLLSISVEAGQLHHHHQRAPTYQLAMSSALTMYDPNDGCTPMEIRAMAFFSLIKCVGLLAEVHQIETDVRSSRYKRLPHEVLQASKRVYLDRAIADVCNIISTNCDAIEVVQQKYNEKMDKWEGVYEDDYEGN